MTRLKQLICCTLATLFTSVAMADDKATAPPITRNLTRLNLSGAEQLITAAREKAVEMKLAMNIAVADEGGHMLAFVRMDGARPGSAYTAMTKAVSAATFRQPTGPLPPNSEPNLLLSLSLPAAASASGGKMTVLKGGLPIVVDGQVIGAVGVGGGTGEQDAEVALAGIDALLKKIKQNEISP